MEPPRELGPETGRAPLTFGQARIGRCRRSAPRTAGSSSAGASRCRHFRPAALRITLGFRGEPACFILQLGAHVRVRDVLLRVVRELQRFRCDIAGRVRVGRLAGAVRALVDLSVRQPTRRSTAWLRSRFMARRSSSPGMASLLLVRWPLVVVPTPAPRRLHRFGPAAMLHRNGPGSGRRRGTLAGTRSASRTRPDRGPMRFSSSIARLLSSQFAITIANSLYCLIRFGWNGGRGNRTRPKCGRAGTS